MNKWFLVLIGICMCSFCHAVLPPFYSSKEEMVAILNHPQMAELFTSAEPIMEMKKVENGYRIAGLRKALFVEVRYLPSPLIGAHDFELIFTPLEEIEQKY